MAPDENESTARRLIVVMVASVMAWVFIVAAIAWAFR